MTTLTREPEAAENPVESPPPKTRSGPRVPRIWLAAGTIVVWVILSIVFHGKKTLEIGGADQIGVQNWIGDRANDLVVADSDNFFLQITSGIADVLDAVIQWFQLLISTPAFPSPYPEIGFLGVLAVAWFFTALVAGWRMSIFTAVCFALFSLLGYYEDSMDLLIVTLVSVGLSVVIGLPLAVWMAHSGKAEMIPNCAIALSMAIPTASQRAARLPVNRPTATSAMAVPMISWIQPQAVKSQTVTPVPPPTVTTSSLRIAASP